MSSEINRMPTTTKDPRVARFHASQAALKRNFTWRVCLVSKTSSAVIDVSASTYAQMVEKVRADYPRSKWIIDDFKTL